VSLSYESDSGAAPQAAWSLLSRPDRWNEWAPHIHGATGLGSPEVEAGRTGFVRLLGLAPVPVRITAKRAGRSWSWRVGPVEMNHQVLRCGEGSTVRVTIDALPGLEMALAQTYGRLIPRLLARLARCAELDY